MEPVTWGFIGTLAGAVVGASVSTITTIITARNSRMLQQDAKSFERKEKAREFQRNNLIDLQEAITVEMRLIGRAHIEDMESFRKNANGGRIILLSEELNLELRNNSARLTILTERVASDSFRQNIKALRNNMTNVLLAKSENESLAAIQLVSNKFQETMEDLGVMLRESY